MGSHHQQYRSYLLRLWRAREGNKSTCRVMLEDVHSGERLGFPNLRALAEHLLRLEEAPVEGTPENREAGEEHSDRDSLIPHGA